MPLPNAIAAPFPPPRVPSPFTAPKNASVSLPVSPATLAVTAASPPPLVTTSASSSPSVLPVAGTAASPLRLTVGGSGSGSLTATPRSPARFGTMRVTPKTLHQHDDTSILSEVSALKDRTRDRKAARKIARNKETIVTLVEAVRSKPNFTKMVEYSLECLRNLAVDDTSVEEMLDEGVVELVHTVLKLNPYNERIHTMANALLQSFCINDTLAASVGAKIGAAPIVHSMRKHVESGTVASSCATAARLMRSEDNVHLLVKGGVLGGLHHLFCTQEESLPVMEAAADCASIIAQHPFHAPLLVESGVAQDVLTALRHYPESEQIVTSGLSAFHALISSHTTHAASAAASTFSPVVSPRSGQRLLDSVVGMDGLVDTLIVAIESHPDNERLLDSGADCLRVLSHGGDMRLLLSVNPGNNAATAAAVSKVSSLLLVERNVDELEKAKGVEWIMRAIHAAQQASADGDTNAHTEAILTSASRALQRLCVDEQRIYSLMQQGAVKQLIALLNTHTANHDLTTAALKALSSMATREESCLYIAKSGGLKAAQAVGAAHPVSEKVAQRILELQSRLAAHEKVVGLQVKGGVVAAIVDAINRRTREACNDDRTKRTLLSALAVTGKMAKHEPTQKEVVTAELLSAVAQLLRVNAADSELVAKAFELLAQFGAQPANLSALRDPGSGLLDAVLACMDVHKGEQSLQDAGNALLTKLSAPKLEVAASSSSSPTPARADPIAAALDSTSAATAAGAPQLDSLLSSVTAVSHLSMLDSNCAPLVQAGAVRRLVDAFESAARLNGSDDGRAAVRTGVMSAAASTLGRLLKDGQGESCRAVLVGGAMRAMVASAVDSSSEEVASSISPMIAVLAADAASAAELMVDGSVHGLLTLARQHHLNDQLVHDASSTIALLVQHDAGNIARIVEWGSAELLVDSLLSYQADLKRTESTLSVITAVTASAAAVPSFLSMDSIAAILEIMKVHSAQPDILLLCMQCLSHFLVTDAAAAEVGQRSGCGLLVKAMRDHYTQEELCELDMMLLDSLASHQPNVQLLLQPELATVELVRWIASKYAKNTRLVESSQRLLQLLEVRQEPKLELGSAFDPSHCDLILSKLRNPNAGKEELVSLCTSLSGLVTAPDKADLLVTKGGLSVLAGILNRSGKDEKTFLAAASALLRVCEFSSDATAGELGRLDVVQALTAVINSGNLGFAQTLSTGDMTSAVRALGRVKMTDATVRQVMQHSPLKTLLSIVCNADDPALLPAAARLLSKLTNHEAASSSIARITNLRELIQAMRRQAAERGAMAEDFLKYGVYLLGNLAANDAAIKEEIGIEGGVQVIVSVMTIDLLRQKAAFVEYCTLALANLSLGSSNNQAFIVACRGIPLLLEAIVTHGRAEELLDNAVCVLCNVCYRNDVNKEAVIAAGGARVLVNTALANFASIPVLLSTFRTLGNLAYNSASTLDIIAAGAVQALVAGVSIHGSNAELVLLCLRVLTNLSSDYGEQSMRTMKEEGAVQAVVEVFHTHAAKEAEREVVLAALLCLCNLGRYSASNKLMVQQGACDDLNAAVTVHMPDVQTVTAASRLINILSHAHPADIDRMLDAKIALAINGILQQHSRVRPVFTNLTAAVTLLAYNSESAAEVGQSGVIAVMIAAVRAQQDDLTLCVDAFPALSALCRDEANAVHMAEAAFSLLSHTLNTAGTDHKLSLHSFAFLSNLCVHPAACQAIVNTRLLTLTFNSLQHHADMPDVLLRGLRAVENLCYTGEKVREWLQRNSLEQHVLAVMNANLRHEDVKKACQAILDAFHAHSIDFAPLPSTAPFRDIEVKSARQLFGDEQKEASTLMPDHIRNFLTAGQLLTKHSRTAPPRPRHVYVTADLKWLIWKDPKRPLHPDNKMKVWKVRGAEKGRCSQQLQRKRFGKWLCREEGAFQIQGRERHVDLEAESEKDREKWCEAITALVEYRKWSKRNATQFDKEDA